MPDIVINIPIAYDNLGNMCWIPYIGHAQLPIFRFFVFYGTVIYMECLALGQPFADVAGAAGSSYPFPVFRAN